MLECSPRIALIAFVKHFFVWVTRGGGLPQAGHTQQSGEPDRRGPEAKPHPRDMPNTPIPGGAQCPDQNSLGVEPTHLLGVLQRLPAQRNHAHPTSICLHVCMQCLDQPRGIDSTAGTNFNSL